MTSGEMIALVEDGKMDARFSVLYGEDKTGLLAQRLRYAQTLREFEQYYGQNREVTLYSAPGRTELGGNHTDHNNGTVLAAAVSLDIIAVTAKGGETLRVRSNGFAGEDVVALRQLQVREGEKNSSAALVRGMAAAFVNGGGRLGGLDIYTTSDVLKGSGLSSSAAFEVCIGMCLNGEYNECRFTPVELAVMAQYAENTYFGKPSGLMDQTACAVGGVISIDFKDPRHPAVQHIPFDLAAHGYLLVITDTGGNHANLTPEYAAIRDEMVGVASLYGAKALRDVPAEQFINDIPAIRKKLGDRAVLRAMHFYADSTRAGQLAQALRGDDINLFLQLVSAGGHSSFEYNQNAYVPAQPRHQGVSLALALSQRILGNDGAWRLQGGGFAGTIQAFVPRHLLNGYCNQMRAVFGPRACHILSFREIGCTQV